MARVIEEVPTKEKRIVCVDGCGKTVGYVPNDLTRRNRLAGGVENETLIGVICPNCKTFITVETR